MPFVKPEEKLKYGLIRIMEFKRKINDKRINEDTKILRTIKVKKFIEQNEFSKEQKEKLYFELFI